MSAILHLIAPHTEHADPTPPERLPYSFDMSQPDAGGMVLIDACIPAAMALEFFKMLQRYCPA